MGWGRILSKTNGDGQPMLNEYNGAVTFYLQMNVLSGVEDIADWITDRSARATYEFEEEKTRRFEWFLSADKAGQLIASSR